MDTGLGQTEQVKALLCILKRPDPTPVAPVSMEDAIAAFHVPYVTTSCALELYQEHIELVRSLFNKAINKYYALYVSIVQSSGYGKSRMLLEASKRHIHTLYACLRPENTSGYPIQNKNVKAFIIPAYCTNTDNAKLFLAVTYKVALEYMGCFAGTPPGSNGGILPLHSLCDCQSDGRDEPKFNNFWTAVSSALEQVSANEDLRKELYQQVGKWRSSYLTAFNQGLVQGTGKFVPVGDAYLPTELVLVFDEARFLLDGKENASYFRCIRAAHRELQLPNFILVFVDTVSTISNFSPCFKHDPSARPTRDFDLLPSFVYVTTYDSLALPATRPHERTSQLSELFSHGRPLWSACFFSKHPVVSSHILEALQFAMIKLSNQPKPSLAGNYFAALACMSMRFGIWGVMDHSYASALLSSYMATALYIGEDRIRMFAHYVPEPILAEAVCQLIYREGTELLTAKGIDPSFGTLKQALEIFESCLVSGLLDGGNIGELVARMTLSLAYDRLHIDAIQRLGEKDSSFVLFSDPISLSSFVDILVPQAYRARYREMFKTDCFNESHDSCRLLLSRGEIAFTSFELIDGDSGLKLTQAFLKAAFSRRFAYIGVSNQAGCDLVIPVRIPEPETGADRYSAVIVQVKNYGRSMESQQLRFNDAGEKLTPEYCCDAKYSSGRQDISDCYLSIYFELNFDRYQKRVQNATAELAISHFNNYGNHVVLLDLGDTTFVDEDIRRMLSALRFKLVDHVEKQTNMRFLKLMAPHRYS